MTTKRMNKKQTPWERVNKGPCNIHIHAHTLSEEGQSPVTTETYTCQCILMHVCVAIQIIPPALWAIGGLGVPIVPSTPLFPKIPWERGLPLPLPVEGRLGSFWTPVGIIFSALGTLGASLWSIWVPFWVPWGTFGHHGHHFVCLGHPLGIILVHLETILGTLGSLWRSF